MGYDVAENISIEVTINGKKFWTVPFTETTLKRLKEFLAPEGATNFLSIFDLGRTLLPEAGEELANIDIFQMSKILTYIHESLTSSMNKAKSRPGPNYQIPKGKRSN